jgi:uncharacterized protein (DUF433 family)
LALKPSETTRSAVAGRARPDIYGGRDPRDFPAYFIGEAAHYLHLPSATISSWAVGRTYPTQTGSRVAQPVITIADPAKRMLSFRNLVELHVLSSILRVHSVDLRAVRRAVKFLRDRFQAEHPLLDRVMLTDGKDLFIEQYGEVVNASAFGQMEMKRILEVHLSRIERDNHGIPVRLFPFTRRYEESPRIVSIDPKVQFGKPCITGTGVPTAIIAERHEAGDPLELLAEDYGRPQKEIEEALRYESRSAS